MPRCKNCREKFEPKHFNQKYCFKSECVKAWVEVAKKNNWKKEKKKLKQELETVQSLTKKAQRYFNAFASADFASVTVIFLLLPSAAVYKGFLFSIIHSM